MSTPTGTGTGLHAPSETPTLPDPRTFTQVERDAHARIYAETGSPIALYLSGRTDPHALRARYLH